MNRKTTKIIEIKARATSGNLRTVQAIAPLDFTLEDCCKLNNIPIRHRRMALCPRSTGTVS